MNRVFIFLILAILLIQPLSGCSGNPSAPGVDPDITPAPSRQSGSVHHCMGYYTLAVDTGSSEISVLPLRSGGWHLNVTGILNATMGVSAQSVIGMGDPANGLYVLDITLTHPFADKPQFSGFDVKGILVVPGSLEVGSVIFPDLTETQLTNADGYTRWWNPTEFTTPGMLGYTQGNLSGTPPSILTATCNPYKVFADILGPEDSLSWIAGEPLDSDLGRCLFSAGASNTRRYWIQFPTIPWPVVKFGYAVDCSWDLPDPNPPLEIPDDFPIEGNQPEAFRIVMQPTANTLYYDSESAKSGGVIRFQINIHDWQGMADGNIEDEISGARIYAPGLYTGGFDASFLDETALKARYTIDLTGIAFPDQAGPTQVFCAVVSADGSTYEQGAEPAPQSLLTAYQAVTLDIPDPECVSDSNNSFVSACVILPGDSIPGQVCDPSDFEDYYFFSINSGFKPSGEINLYCNAPPTNLELYDYSHNLIASEGLSNAVATINLDDLTLMPGINYLKISTTNNSQVVPYLLELDADFIDVEPTAPVEVTPMDLFAKGSHIWRTHTHAILTGTWGVWVYDMADPSHPELESYNFWSVGTNAAMYGNRLYYVITSLSPDGICMIDFTDPANPVRYTDTIPGLGGGLAGMTMSSTHLYIGTPNQIGRDVVIFDYGSAPTSPIEVGTIVDAGQPRHLALINPDGPNKKLVVGTYDDVRVLDVDDPEITSQIGLYPIVPGLIEDLITSQYRVYFTHYNSATEVGTLFALEYNTVIPNDLAEVGSVPLPGEAEALYKWNPYVYIADGTQGLTMVDVSDHSAMFIESNTPTISEAWDVIVYGDQVNLLPWDAGMQVFDASNPSAPAEIGRLQVVDGPIEAAIVNDSLIVALLMAYSSVTPREDSASPTTS